MAFKIACSIVAALLVIVFISPVVVKLKDVALSVVALIGVSLMIIDIWYSLRSKED